MHFVGRTRLETTGSAFVLDEGVPLAVQLNACSVKALVFWVT